MTRRYNSISVETSNESKTFFPDAGLTKGDLIEYYEKIAGRLLPFLKNRPLVMQRFPDGIQKSGFYHKQVPDHFPDWIDRVRVEKENGRQDLVVCNKKATLVYLADQGCVTLHRWLCPQNRLHHPDVMVVDLDPPSDDLKPVRRAALLWRDLFEELNVPSYVGTSGSKGLHVTVPLDGSLDFDAVRRFARKLADHLAARHPDRLTVEQRKAKRAGRVFLDVGRNAYAQTAVAPYTVRARKAAPVAVPLQWDEVQSGKIKASGAYTVQNIFRRLAQMDDPWSDFKRRGVSLAQARERFEALPGSTD